MHLKTGIYYLVYQIAAVQLLLVQLQSACVYGCAMVHDMVVILNVMALYPETGTPGGKVRLRSWGTFHRHLWNVSNTTGTI